MRNLPIVTIALCTLCSGLMLLPTSWHEALYFNATAVHEGRFLTLLTGHLIHADTTHLIWNMLALTALGFFLECRSRALLAGSILMGVVAVNLLLLSSLAEVDRYCGFSGVLNTLLGVALYCYWRDTRSYWVAFTAALAIGKIVVEIALDTSLFTDISWPPYPPAHLAGMLGAGILLCAQSLFRNRGSMSTGLQSYWKVTGAAYLPCAPRS